MEQPVALLLLQLRSAAAACLLAFLKHECAVKDVSAYTLRLLGQTFNRKYVILQHYKLALESGRTLARFHDQLGAILQRVVQIRQLGLDALE
jgi:hypothetical protein